MKEDLYIFLMLILWIVGIVIANGFWSTLFAFFPFYAWYLVVEHVMKINQWI